MRKDTPAARVRRWSDLVEHLLFREPDMSALARGWEVHRPTPFRRVYRDPRWHRVVACPSCRGTGFAGARPCAACFGCGTVRLADAVVGR